MRHLLRMTKEQDDRLRAHVLPADGREAAAVALCGRGQHDDTSLLVVREIHEIPYEACAVRRADQLVWSTGAISALLPRAMREHLAVIKVHGHPNGFPAFSATDDASDRELFKSIHGWTDDGLAHGSMVMLPGGAHVARVVDDAGQFVPFDLVTVLGDDLRIFGASDSGKMARPFTRRNSQAFGAMTTEMLGRLRVAIVGVSGTGQPLAEQLLRLGVGTIVLVDPDRVEELNLNRLPHATFDDAKGSLPKVEATARAVRVADIGTRVITLQRNLKDPEVVRAVSACDVVFGCMDGAEGRHLLNRLATFYTLPYIDVGVRLEADGHGGIRQICGSVHWLRPGGSSLLSRGVITLEAVRAEGLRRRAPGEYERLRKEKYIKGVDEERPAVISVNTLFSSLAACELLARLHPFRDDDNAEYARLTISLTQVRFESAVDGPPCSVLARHVGRGDVAPLLDDPELSEAAPCARSA
jgi:hypothetical protein